MDNDRVRLYGKRTADVHSIASPTRFEAFLFLIKEKNSRNWHKSLIQFDVEISSNNSTHQFACFFDGNS